MLIEDTAVFLQLEDFVQLLNAFCSGLCLRAVSADDIRYKACVVAHSGHLDHCLCAVLECAKHSRAHLTACSFLKNCVGIAVIVELVVFTLAHNFDLETHSGCEAVELHNSAGLIACGTGVDNAVILCELVKVWSNNNVCLNVEHDDMLAVSHGICSNLCAYIRNTGAVDHALNTLSLGDKI